MPPENHFGTDTDTGTVNFSDIFFSCDLFLIVLTFMRFYCPGVKKLIYMFHMRTECEPEHDKTKYLSVRPVENLTSLFNICTIGFKTKWVLIDANKAHSKNHADAQADLRLH